MNQASSHERIPSFAACSPSAAALNWPRRESAPMWEYCTHRVPLSARSESNVPFTQSAQNHPALGAATRSVVDRPAVAPACGSRTAAARAPDVIDGASDGILPSTSIGGASPHKATKNVHLTTLCRRGGAATRALPEQCSIDGPGNIFPPRLDAIAPNCRRSATSGSHEVRLLPTHDDVRSCTVSVDA